MGYRLKGYLQCESDMPQVYVEDCLKLNVDHLVLFRLGRI